MSDRPEKTSARQHLPVLNPADKVEQLRREMGNAPAPPRPADQTLVERFVDPSKTPGQKAIEEKVIEALRTVYDPELPVNIYDLGLIYDIAVHPKNSAVHVKMTLTAPACPVAGQIVADVQRRIEALDEVSSATVELVWDPPWSKDRMSEAALLELGLL